MSFEGPSLSRSSTSVSFTIKLKNAKLNSLHCFVDTEEFVLGVSSKVEYDMVVLKGTIMTKLLDIDRKLGAVVFWGTSPITPSAEL